MELNHDYIEKVYIFARARTGSIYDGEDLAQEILLEVVKALKKGTQPHHFNAWFWTIARRKYAQYVQKQKLHRLSGVLAPHHQAVNQIEQLDEQLADGDDVRAIYRELSRLAKIYRSIMIKHYLEDKSTGEIAEELGIPTGTVKRRLHHGRQLLKRGVTKVTHLTGKRSCMPDTITFWTNGPAENIQGYLRRQLAKNILSASAQKSVTIDELCGEIGLARPYMEEEVELLEEATLLRKVNQSTYAADLIILDRSLIDELLDEVTALGDSLAPQAYEVLISVKEDILNLDFYGNTFDWKFLSWIFIDSIVDAVLERAAASAFKNMPGTLPAYNKPWYIGGIRENTEEQRFISIYRNQQSYRLPERDLVVGFYGYQDDYHFPSRINELDSHSASLILGLLLANQSNSEFSYDEKEILAGLIAKGILKKEGSSLLPAVPIFKAGHTGALYSIITPKVRSLAEPVADLWIKIHDKMAAALDKELHNQINTYVLNLMLELRQSMVSYGLEQGLLSYPAENTLPLEAMYLIYGDTFFNSKVQPIFERCIKEIYQLEYTPNSREELVNRFKASIKALTGESNGIIIQNSDHSRVGGKTIHLKNHLSNTQLTAADIDIRITEYKTAEQILTGFQVNNTYSGRPRYQDSKRIIWVVWCNVNQGINSCFALFNLDRFMISINADTNIDSSIFNSGDWDSILVQPGIKQKLLDSAERLDAVIKHFVNAV